MDNQHYVGIDISKKTLDWAVFDSHNIVFCTSTENSIPGIKSALNQMREIPGLLQEQTVFCMEHTGIYNAHLLDFLYKAIHPIWLENSTQIKQAGGMQRGKNDSIDARRIAEDAFRFRDRTPPGARPPVGTTPPGHPAAFFSERPPLRCCPPETYPGPQAAGWADCRAGVLC